jgi:HlyD family secretion protein
VDSTIHERNVEVGEFVTTGFVGDRGAKGYVVSIADLRDLLVELDISQNDFAKVFQNQPCWITTDAYPDRKYNGQVQLISPVANRQKATVLVRVKITNPDLLLKPDMNATVAFLAQPKPAGAGAGGQGAVTATGRPPVRVPAHAVHDGAVLVVEEGKVLRRPVTVGLTTANGEIEIRTGLIGGEDLIVHSPIPLQQGDRVKISQSVPQTNK